jgi:hypothetical protein
MKVAKEMVQQNQDKESLAKELEMLAGEAKGISKEIDRIKRKLLPLMSLGERIGLVEKSQRESLDVSEEMLAALEVELGSEVVRKELNTSWLRERMAEDTTLDKRIPRKAGDPFLTVGEKKS